MGLGIQKVIKVGLLLVLVLAIQGCFTFNPSGSRSSLIIVSVMLDKDESLVNEIVEPVFDKVSLYRGNREIIYSKRSGHYYYFQNLLPGQYELGEMVHLIQKGNAGNSFANRDVPNSIRPPLTREDRLKTLVNLEPGSVVFLGEVQVNAVFRVKEDPVITGSFRRSISAEKRAMNHLMRSFPRSGWAALAKERLKSLNVINLGDGLD